MDQTHSQSFKINSNELFNFSLRPVSVSIYVIFKKNVNQYSLAVCCAEVFISLSENKVDKRFGQLVF